MNVIKRRGCTNRYNQITIQLLFEDGAGNDTNN